MERTNVVLTGRGVYSQFQIISAALQGNRSNGDTFDYYRATYGGKAFTVTPEVAEAWKKAEIAELVLSPNTFTKMLIDEETDTETEVTVEGWTYGGHLTYTQAQNIARNEGTLKGIEMQVAQEYNLPIEA